LLILWPWRWRRYVPPERQLTFNRLHSIISQKTVLLITTAVRTSNPTYHRTLYYYLNIFIDFTVEIRFNIIANASKIFQHERVSLISVYHISGWQSFNNQPTSQEHTWKPWSLCLFCSLVVLTC
jgi:hypothetical protein